MRLGIDDALDGLKRGAAKFGGTVAARVVKKFAVKKNGLAPTEQEPYGVGMGGATTEQTGLVNVKFAVGDTVTTPNGKSGKVINVTSAGKVVVETNVIGDTWTYEARDLKHLDPMKNSDSGAVDSSSLGFQSTQKTTTAQREKEEIENALSPEAARQVLEDLSIGMPDEGAIKADLLSPAEYEKYKEAMLTLGLRPKTMTNLKNAENKGKCPGCSSIMSKIDEGNGNFHWWCDNCAKTVERANLKNSDAGDLREKVVSTYGSELISGNLSSACRALLTELAKETGIDLQIILKDVKADAKMQNSSQVPDLPEPKENADVEKYNHYVFRDASGEEEGFDARTRAAAWQSLANRLGCEVDEAKKDFKMVTANENSLKDANRTGDSATARDLKEGLADTAELKKAIEARISKLEGGSRSPKDLVELEEAKKELKQLASRTRELENSPEGAKCPKCSQWGQAYGSNEGPKVDFACDNGHEWKLEVATGKKELQNAGHLTAESWIAASLDERAQWLEGAAQDVNLATSNFADLSQDVLVALQDGFDKPASQNNGNSGAAAVKGTEGFELVDPVLNASGKPELKKFVFTDVNGEEEVVPAPTVEKAWETLAGIFGEPVATLKKIGVKFVRENSDPEGDLTEISRHAEGIEHEVEELLENGKVTTVTLRSGDTYDLEVLDQTHVRMKLAGTDKWGIPLHVQQLQLEVIKQLQDSGTMDSRKYVNKKNSGLKNGAGDPLSGGPCSCGHDGNKHFDTGHGEACHNCSCDIYEPVITCRACGDKERVGVAVGGLCEECQNSPEMKNSGVSRGAAKYGAKK